MTRTILKAMTIALALFVLAGCGDSSCTDRRDGKVYATTQIGKQLWMAENLNYAMDGSYCFDDDPANCEKYGRLYTWDAAMKACPEGWHLPTSEEWNELGETLGEKAGKKLKSKEWDGTDEFGFNALPASFRWAARGAGFDRLGNIAFFWTATEDDGDRAYNRYLRSSGTGLDSGSYYKGGAYSVRCVRKAPKSGNNRETKPANRRESEINDDQESKAADRRESTFTDNRDGKTYAATKIGKQVWMAENLDYAADSSWCYKDDPANCGKYGRLYTWNAAMKACPEGWHLPTRGEWNQLEEAIGAEAGAKLKSKEWDGADAFGFNALPAGGRGDDGAFDFMGAGAYFWTATEYGGYDVPNIILSSADTWLDKGRIYKNFAHSVRCVKD